MPPFIDSTGEQIGKWAIGEYLGRGYYMGTCRCGRTQRVNINNVRRGKSDGCRKCREYDTSAMQTSESRETCVRNLRLAHDAKNPERGIYWTAHGWQVIGWCVKARRNVGLGYFQDQDDAILAGAQWRWDQGLTDIQVPMEPRLYEVSAEGNEDIVAPKSVRAYSDYPNVRFGADLLWNPWTAQVQDQGSLYIQYCATELEAALWAVEKKLELGHGQRPRLEARRERILALMEAGSDD